jgi:hypothetical protein
MSIEMLLDPLREPPPGPARIADALTRGWHNFAADRQVARRLLAADPNMYWWVAAHYHFRSQAMIALARAGIRQWIHLGCGVANDASAYALLDDATCLGGGRLVCVDDDPVIVEHLRGLAPPANPDLRVTAVRAGLDDPHQLMADIVHRDGVDLGEPVAILLTGVLHEVGDTIAAALLTVLREYVMTGSYLVLSHPSSPHPMTAALTAAIEHYQHVTDTTWTLRGPHTAPPLLGDGWTPLPPGIVDVGRWQPFPRLGDEDVDEQDPAGPDALRTAAGWAVLAAAVDDSSG